MSTNNEEIPALAVIEGYRKHLAEATEENLILRWQVQQKDEQIAQLVAALEQQGSTNGSAAKAETPAEDPVVST